MFVKYGIYTALFLVLFLGCSQCAVALDVTVTARVHGCGDNIVDADEQCDGNPVTHNSCTNLGFTGGSLSCTNACNYDTSSCSVGNTNRASSGFSNITNFFKNTKSKSYMDVINEKLPKNSVIFEGDAKPESVVTISNGNNQVVAKTKTDSDGKYSISVANVSSANNVFTLTNEAEAKTFIVNMYSDSVVKYNDVSLKNLNWLKIMSLVAAYEKKWNLDLTERQTKVN